MHELKQEIILRQTEMANYFNAGEFEHIVDRVFHPAARLYGPNMDVIKGREDLTAFLREEQKDSSAKLAFHLDDFVSKSDDLGIAIGHYSVTSADGKTQLHTGKYFQVYERVENGGEVRLIHEMWSE